MRVGDNFIENCKENDTRVGSMLESLGFSVSPYGLVNEEVYRETEGLFKTMEDSAIDVCSKRVMQVSSREFVIGDELFTVIACPNIDNVILYSSSRRFYRVSFRYSHLDFVLFDQRARMYGEVISHEGRLYCLIGFKNQGDVLLRKIEAYKSHETDYISRYDLKLTLREYLKHRVVAHLYSDKYDLSETITANSDLSIPINNTYVGESLYFGDTELRIVWVDMDTVVLKSSAIDNIIVVSMQELILLKTYKKSRFKGILGETYILNGFPAKATDFVRGMVVFNECLGRAYYPIRLLHLCGLGRGKEINTKRCLIGYTS